MTPRRFALLILALLLPAGLWASVAAGKEDLLYRTRSFMSQAKRDRPGKFEGFAELCRMPDADPAAADPVLYRLWRSFKACNPASAAYGSNTPVRLADGREHDHREVVVTGRDERGRAVAFQVQWVRLMGNWYIQDVTGWEPAPEPPGGSREEAAPSPL